MSDGATPHPLERLLPFVLKTKSLLVGCDTLRANKSKLHFVKGLRDAGCQASEQCQGENLAVFHRQFPFLNPCSVVGARYFCGNVTFGTVVNGSIPNFGYASVG